MRSISSNRMALRRSSPTSCLEGGRFSLFSSVAFPMANASASCASLNALASLFLPVYHLTRYLGLVAVDSLKTFTTTLPTLWCLGSFGSFLGLFMLLCLACLYWPHRVPDDGEEGLSQCVRCCH